LGVIAFFSELNSSMMISGVVRQELGSLRV
jgi:hypothetical protein